MHKNKKNPLLGLLSLLQEYTIAQSYPCMFILLTRVCRKGKIDYNPDRYNSIHKYFL